MQKPRFPLSAAILAAGLLGVLLTSRCSFDEPAAPTWDLSLVVPLADRTYTMTDLADDVDEITVDPTNDNLLFRHQEEIEPFQVGEYLRIDGGEDNLELPLLPLTPVGWDTTLTGEVHVSRDIIVESAEIRRGYVDFWATNPTAYNLRIEVTVPSLTRNGEPIPIAMEVQQGSNYRRTWLDSALLSLDGRNVVDYSANVKVLGGESNTGGLIEVRVAISDIYFKSITGVLDHLAVSMDTTVVDVDIPEQAEGVQLEDAYLYLSVLLGYSIPADVSLVMEGVHTRSGCTEPRISLDATLTPVSGTDTTTVCMGDVADLLNCRPDRILIYGSLELGDGKTRETLRDTDRIGGSALIEAPLIFSLSEDTTEVDPEALDIDEEARERIRDDLLSAVVEAELGNHLPFGTLVTLLFDTTRVDSTIYDDDYTPNLVIGPLEVREAPVDGDPGLVTGEAVSTVLVNLDKDDLAVFENANAHMGTRIVILGPSQRTLKVRASDYIRVRANLRAGVHVNLE